MSTFITLTNKVLRRINEVELTSTNFVNAKGVHALAKDAINDAVNSINAQRFEWPFNAFEHQQVLQIGYNEYAWPATLKTVDWESFEIQKDDDNQARALRLINRDEWYIRYRDTDYNNLDTGISIPDFVFPTHGEGFGVSPVPDANYTVRYRYWITPGQMVNETDTTTIPEQFEYVIIDGALYIINMFREADNTLGFVQKNFAEGIKAMVNVLLNDYEHVYDTRVNY